MTDHTNEGQPTLPVPCHLASSGDQDLTGTRIGRYDLRKLLGQGGMGLVYLARDTSLATDVALKVLRGDISDREEELHQLRAEVTLAQKISHPNVCRTYDLEEADGHSFVKMEFINGETLAQRCRHASVTPIAEVLRIVRAVVRGLDAAHTQGVVHCDLKPENILLEHGTGRVALMDFGLARLEVRSRGMGGRAVSGTPAYMAPEQLKGGPVDGRTDLYALGCVLYELLVGELPYPEATSFENAERCIAKAIPDPRRKRSKRIPTWLSNVVQRLLAKDPEQRWRTASEVLQALEGPPQRLTRRMKIMGAVAAAVSAVSLTWYAASRRHPPWQPKIQIRQPVYNEDASNAALSPDGKGLAYVASRNGEWRLYLEPMAGGSRRPLATIGYLYPVQWTHDNRAVLGVMQGSRAVRISVEDGSLEEITRGAFEVVDCAGRLILAIEGAGGAGENADTRLLIRERAGEPPRELLRFPQGTLVKDLQCDRTGRQLIYAVVTTDHYDRSDIHLLDLDQGAPRRLTSDQHSNRSPVFAPDGKSVIFASWRSGHSELWEIPLQGSERPLILPGNGPVAVLTGLNRIVVYGISPDGKTLLFGEERPTRPLYTYRLDTHERRPISLTLDHFTNPRFTPDDRDVIVTLHRQGKNYAAALSVQNGDETIFSMADVQALTPDGREVVVANNGEQGSEIQAVSRLGKETRTLGQFPKPVLGMVVGGDGWIYAWLGTLDHPQGIWKLPLAGGEAIHETLPQDAVLVPAPTGGYRLLGRRVNHLVFRWSLLPPGAPPDAPASKTFDARYGLSWAPDGKSFLTWTGREIVHHDVATGAEQILLRSDLAEGGMALSSDRKTLAFAEWSGLTSRQMIVNFDERPRPWD